MPQLVIVAFFVFYALALPAQDKLRDLFSAKAPEGFVEREWTVDGVKRTALVRVPAGVAGQVAVVFCWHGHGGRAAQAAGRWGYDKADTTSILVFPAGPADRLTPRRQGRPYAGLADDRRQ